MSWRRGLYSGLMWLLVPIFLLRLFWRGRQNPSYRQRISERLGFVPQRNLAKPCIWLHAVSVGETIAARPLVDQLLKEYPDYDIWITTTTPTGSDTVKRLFGDQVKHSYFPYDTTLFIQRFLKRVQPNIVLIMETELWANLFHICQRQRIPLLVCNARLSERSFQGYQKIQNLVSETLNTVDFIAARSEQDREYFMQLGMPPERIQAVGNIKFDLQLPNNLQQTGQTLRKQWGAERLVWVAASTHAGEDEVLLRVFQQLQSICPELLLILVPRHPERFKTVTQLCEVTGLTTATRSQFEQVSPHTQVIVGDSMGELLLWYAAGDMAFIGGSLIEHGGHNPLEAAAFELPIVSGKHVHNFMDIFPLLEQQKGAVLVESEAALREQIEQWITQPQQRLDCGQAAGKLLLENTGVVQSLCDMVATTLEINDEKEL